MKQHARKYVGLLVVAIVLINFFLFIFTRSSWQVFLVVLLLAFIFTKFIFPKL